MIHKTWKSLAERRCCPPIKLRTSQTGSRLVTCPCDVIDVTVNKHFRRSFIFCFLGCFCGPRYYELFDDFNLFRYYKLFDYFNLFRYYKLFDDFNLFRYYKLFDDFNLFRYFKLFDNFNLFRYFKFRTKQKLWSGTWPMSSEFLWRGVSNEAWSR